MVGAVGSAIGLCSCGGGQEQPIRIAVFNQCYGPFGAGHEAQLGAAELPLIERGAKLTGPKPSDGLAGAEVAGRKVELLIGCAAEGGDALGSPQELLEVRRLVEHERAEVVVGLGGPMTIALREYAKRHPSVAFVPTIPYQSTAFRNPAPNLFSIFPDFAMKSAGLGAYAYNVLGWRRAVTIDADNNLGWTTTAGFVAPFCGLGGHIVKRIWVPHPNGAANSKAAAAQVPRQRIDGIHFGAGDNFVLIELGRTNPLFSGDVGRKIVGHWYNLRADPKLHEVFGRRLDGVADEPETLNPSNPAFGRFARLYTKVFPKHNSFFGRYGGQYHYTAMEAILRALERVDGDLSDRRRRFMAALANTDIAGPPGRLRLDSRRQAIGPAYVDRLRWNPKTKSLDAVETFTYPNVDQTFGGYFTPDMPPPSRTSPPCRKLRNPPTWMRAGK